MSARVIDRHQQAAADPAASVWVAASAGTGKTHVLTNRVLRLMLAGSEPGKILCLTFTRAAAAEMANRLHERLGQWATLAEADLAAEIGQLCETAPTAADMDLARQLFARVLDVPGGLKIQTIHAFCQSLLARFPLEAGLPTNFEVMDERSSAGIMAGAVDAILARVARAADSELSTALDRVLYLAGEFGFQKLLREFSGKRGKLDDLLARHGGREELALVLRGRLGLAPGDDDGTVVAAAVAAANIDENGLRAAAGVLLDGSNKNDGLRGAAIADWLAAPAGRIAGLADYARVFLTQRDEPRQTLMSKPLREKFPAEAEALEAEARRLMDVAARRKMVATAEASEALLVLGGAVEEEFRAAKLRHAMLDYDDLILATRDLLRRPGVAPWVLYKLDGGLDHILIDEAQDTSPEQWQVIAALAGEFFAGLGAREQNRTVFAVGDLKQSIFSFQGADPRSFGAMREHFRARAEEAEVPFGPIPLDLSFRSTEAVLKLVDEVFAAPAARDGLTLDDAPLKHVAHRAGQAGAVELWPLVVTEPREADAPWAPPVRQDKIAGAAARLAGHLARAIKGWIGEQRLESQNRAVRPGDILVLLRQRGAFAGQLVTALKRQGVAVAGADRMTLTEQLGVMDLMALGRFVLLPADDLNLAVVLKGPLFGLDDDDLLGLAHGRKGTLWRALAAARKGDKRFARAHDELAHLMGEADFVPPYEFFARLLGAGGARRRLLGRLGPEAEDAINEFLDLALDYGRRAAPGLEGFLHWVGAAETEIKRDMEQGADEVRVMTVHGAKGLQAPIVILPDTTQKPRVRPALLTLAAGPEAEAAETAETQTQTEEELFVWPVAGAREAGACAPAQRAADLERDREYRRLLYVALTRARDRLYVCGWETSRRRDTGCWYDLVAEAFERLPQVETVDGELGAVQRFATAQEAPPEAAALRRRAAAAADPLPGWAAAPAPAEADPPRPLAPSRPRGPEPAVIGPFPGTAGDGTEAGAGLARGRLIHRLLEILPALAPADREAAARAYLDAAGRLAAPDAAAMVRETMAVLEDPGLAPLFGPGSLAEAPLAGIVEGRVISGQVDRLLVREDEILVLDYKTNRRPPDTPGQVPAAYLDQMAAYRALLVRIFPGRPVRCAILWTDGPVMMPLDADILDRPLR